MYINKTFAALPFLWMLSFNLMVQLQYRSLPLHDEYNPCIYTHVKIVCQALKFSAVCFCVSEDT